MSMTALHKLTLSELQRKFTAGDVTATEIVRAYFLRVGQVEPKVKAYLTKCQEAAIAQAESLDRTLKGWRKTTPMMGMPLAVKDNICTEGVRTTCASRMLETFLPPYDATVVAKLRAQNYLLLRRPPQIFLQLLQPSPATHPQRAVHSHAASRVILGQVVAPAKLP